MILTTFAPQDAEPEVRIHGAERGMTFRLFRQFDDVREDWRALEKTAIASPFQTLFWCETWWNRIGREKGAKPAFVAGYRGDNLEFLLPLITCRCGPLSIVQSMRDKNAAMHGALSTRAFADWARNEDMFGLADILRALIPNTDIFVLSAQTVEFNTGVSFGQPFNLLQTDETISMTRLVPDWETFYHGKRNAKARRKARNKVSRLKKMGDLQFRVADGIVEQLAMFDALAEQKSQWFQSHGIPDLFAAGHNYAFLRDLASRERNPDGFWPLISGVSLDGEWIAMNMGAVHNNHFVGVILSTAEGAAKKLSPGSHLVTRTMEYCAENGIDIFNFGAGQNDLKDRWADDSDHLVLATLPQTVRGKVYESALRMVYTLKDRLKKKPFLWRRFQSLQVLFTPYRNPVSGKQTDAGNAADGNADCKPMTRNAIPGH